MRLWMGKRVNHQPFPGRGPNVVRVGQLTVHGRDRGPDYSGPQPAIGQDEIGPWRHRGRMKGSGPYAHTSMSPARSRKHRGGR
jgi:hypothetical protein